MEKHWAYELEKLDLSDNKYSQFGEEIIVRYILDETLACLPPNFLVDIGAGGANKGLSNSKRLLEDGFSGLLFDMDGSEGTIKEFITPFNIVELLKKNNCPKEFDFLSVDIDSFDYDVLDAVLSEYKPRIVCVEFNGTLEPYKKLKLKYEEGYTWDGTNKYGFSFLAGLELFKKYGYTVVLNQQDTNLWAVSNKLLPEGFKKEIFGNRNVYHPINKKAEWINL